MSDPYHMEQALLKLARQLNAIDEASLTALWEKYAAEVERFEPGKRWEEAVLALGMIQTVRWKNMLFNEKWREIAESPESRQSRPAKLELVAPAGEAGEEQGRKSKVLKFPGREDGPGGAGGAGGPGETKS